MRTSIARTALFALLFFASAGVASAQSCPVLGSVVGNTITKRFLSTTPTDPTPEWRVSFGFSGRYGLYITGAAFRRDTSERFMQVLYDARVSDILVPYHTGQPRYLDLSVYGQLVGATPEDAGPCGQVLGGFVVHQVNNSELAWKNDSRVRRREELVLWATSDAGNYNYIISYAFRDDGTISLRFAPTGSNLPTDPFVAHMHSALWRIDMDLNGTSDTPYWMKHDEVNHFPAVLPGFPSYKAKDTMTLFNGGREGAMRSDADQFNHVLIQDKTLNARGHKISYEFMPVRMGNARHLEKYTWSDFWVTRFDPNEMDYTQITNYAGNEVITDRDVIVWHMSPMHHQPRDEDGFVDSANNWNGVALIMWSGIDLRPRNLWDRTPMYSACVERPGPVATGRKCPVVGGGN